MRKSRTAFRRFWPLTRGDRKWPAVIVACVVVAALAETASVLLFAELTDNALKAGSLAAFWGPAAAWLGVAVLGAVVGYLGNSLATWTAERFVLRLRAKVFRHVQDLPPHFFQKHRRGDLVERLTGDVEAIEQMVVSGVVGTVAAVFSALFYSAAALYLRWDLALATFVLAPLFLLAARRFAGRVRTASQDERVADGAITSVVEESLGHVVLTQAYNRHGDEEKRLDREARAWMKASVRGARLSEMYEQFGEVVETVCVLAVIGLGVWEISAGRMTLGQLLAFAAFIGYLYPPVRNLGQLGLTLTAATAGAQRLGEILDAEPAVTDPAEPVGPWPVHGRIGFHGVSFRYPGATRDSLTEVTFTAGPGELVVITGPSGAGKSTAAKLLTRFYDPGSGAITLDGVPLPHLDLCFLRENVTLLPQETLILNGTVRENIACGRPGASHEDIEQAARSAAAHDFITALPEGYDTHIAPGTAALSGGQLKRLTIARAMLLSRSAIVVTKAGLLSPRSAAMSFTESLVRRTRSRVPRRANVVGAPEAV
ncbi:ABC transporter ATP-binding protein [Streptomyces sp. NPDC008343]|uniref:ABC transporter ATP-binding protein n=1 Tax=Streptomyces sp. NPDC008343 TaxID=3364828 RepID=UPI0036E53420